MKLAFDEEEDLALLCNHDGLKVLFKHMDEIVTAMERDVITRGLPDNVQEATVALYKLRCKADGARSVTTLLKQQLRDFLVAKNARNAAKELDNGKRK